MLEKSGGRLILPDVSIPRWTRAARRVAALIRHRWHTRAVVLDFLGDDPGGEAVVIAERIDEQQEAHGELSAAWHPLDAVPADQLSPAERALIRILLDKGSTGRGPFSQLGWTEDLLTWSSNVLKLARSQLSETVVQLNAAADAALVRISTQDGFSYWFKAAGASHPYERRVTARLAQQFPAYVPEVVAVHEQWNGWLTRDSGVPLSCSFSDRSSLALEAVRRLAELQIASSSLVRTLLFDGCHDHRLPTLRAQIPELIPYLEEAMQEPGVHVGIRIEASRLRRVAALILEATFRIEDAGIPDALMHCDIDLDNILAGPHGCVFTDWAHASVGPPLITFEHLCGQFAQHHQTRNLIPRLRSSYLDVWKASLSIRHPDRALTFVPLVALASLLCCQRERLMGTRKGSSHSYARVLARQMDVAAQRIEETIRSLTGSVESLMGEQWERANAAATGSEIMNTTP